MKGTVRRRESGSWAWQFTVRTTEGRRHFSKGGFGTRREAQAGLSSALAEHNRGVLPKRSRDIPTLAEFFESEWVPVLGGLKPTTRANYRWLATNYVIPKIGHHKLNDVTAADLVALYAALKETGGRRAQPLSESTVHKVHVVCSALFGHAVELGLLSASPVTRVPRRSRPSPKGRHRDGLRCWTAPEARQFLDNTHADRLAVAWVLLLSTGMRRGEVAGLRWIDVDLERDFLTVRRNRVSVGYAVSEGEPKSGRGRRVTLDRSTVSALRGQRSRQAAWRLKAGSAWVDSGQVVTDELGAAIHPETLTKAFAHAAVRSGVPAIRLHDLRHTHATLLLADGIPAKVVQERLGHASISITLDLYGHITAELEQEAADRIGAILDGRRAPL